MYLIFTFQFVKRRKLSIVNIFNKEKCKDSNYSKYSKESKDKKNFFYFFLFFLDIGSILVLENSFKK